jgi:hypothetical protein
MRLESISACSALTTRPSSVQCRIMLGFSAQQKRVEAYVKSHLDESKRLNAAGNVVDVRQLLLEQKAHR